MTGFARVSRPTDFGELTLAIKTVNHRGLDVHFHMPFEFDSVEPALRSVLRKRVVRGHVQVQLSFRRNAAASSGQSVNEALLESWLQAFRAAADRFGIDSKPDLNRPCECPACSKAPLTRTSPIATRSMRK
jgi:uncharacterized protein (TIGR00255 family)